ncbi:MAG: polymer-forming cytoskeletal protein [Halioglobus sp.]|nr:polymer-forming cytoskeletal protein [Halioglobus sp.]
MFDRNKGKPVADPVDAPAPAPGAPAAASPGAATSRSDAMIGPSIYIKGTVSGDEDLLVQGRVEGTIELSTHEVSVGQSGRVAADIKANVVRIEGEVTGDITGQEKVVISRSGTVRGNIVAPRVTLEDGAIFKGSIDMDPGDSPAAKTPAPAAVQPAAPKSNSSDLDRKSG